MKKSHGIGANFTSNETISGFLYLAFQLLLMPELLNFINDNLQQPLNSAELNFLFYFVNFIAILVIFRRFLGNSLDQVWQHPIWFLESVILGFVFYYLCKIALDWLMDHFVPSFSNYNDDAIAAMSKSNYFLMFLGTVILVPPVEECFYRGLIFRNLYPKSRWAAYVVSILAFTMIHIMGFLGRYTALELLLAVIQYLPAGFCLAWAYARSNTIFAPIVIHAAINYVGISQMR
jgi:membrane protease YdiL (CAAX protease family)